MMQSELSRGRLNFVESDGLSRRRVRVCHVGFTFFFFSCRIAGGWVKRGDVARLKDLQVWTVVFVTPLG